MGGLGAEVEKGKWMERRRRRWKLRTLGEVIGEIGGKGVCGRCSS